MLKAYSFSKQEKINVNMYDKTIYEREKKLALEFVKNNPSRDEPGYCPLCGSSKTALYSHFEGTVYMRCERCWSLYVPVNKDILSAYRTYAPLKEHRLSEKYQESARQKRSTIWNELLFWIAYRSERYLRPLRDLRVFEINGRYESFREIAAASCASFTQCSYINEDAEDYADAVLYFGALSSEPDVYNTFRAIKKLLVRGGLLFLDSRVSTGFDILTLGSKINNIYPYEHSILPSIEALEIVLVNTGFEVLEILTPGTLDMKSISDNISQLDENNLFVRYLLEKADDTARMEFQRFLQKNTLSSYAQIVAMA